MYKSQKSIIDFAIPDRHLSGTDQREIRFSIQRPYKEAYKAGLSSREIRILLYLQATEGCTTYRELKDDLLMNPPEIFAALRTLRLSGFLSSRAHHEHVPISLQNTASDLRTRRRQGSPLALGRPHLPDRSRSQ